MKSTAHCSLLNLISPASGTLNCAHPCRLNTLIHERYPQPPLNPSPQSTVHISNTNPQNPLQKPRDLYRNGPERINSVTHPSSRRSVSVSGSSNTVQPRLTVTLHPHNGHICNDWTIQHGAKPSRGFFEYRAMQRQAPVWGRRANFPFHLCLNPQQS